MAEVLFNLGTKVHCQDGESGKLAKVVINPKTSHLTDLIVEKGFLFKTDRVAPITVLERVSGPDIYLGISSAQLATCLEYKLIEIEEPDFSRQPALLETPNGIPEATIPMVRRKIRQGVIDGLVVVGRATTVHNIEGEIGLVEYLLVDPASAQVTHVVVRHGAFFPEHLIVPWSLIRDIDDEAIFLVGSNQSLDQLDRYPSRSDETLQAEAEARLAEIPLFTDDVLLSVRDRVVCLTGVVESEAAKTAAARVVGMVDGVVEVQNELAVKAE